MQDPSYQRFKVHFGIKFDLLLHFFWNKLCLLLNARIHIQDYVNHGVWLRHFRDRDAVEELPEIINDIFIHN